MSAIDDLPPLRDVIREHSLSARKSLGQNFLLDLNLTARIARAAGPLEDATVIEVGPGPGGLTRALLALGARRVIAVERDERCLAALDDVAKRYPGRLEVVHADALAFRSEAACSTAARRKIVANLPYNIGTPLLVGLAVDRAVAALVRHAGADVPARSGGAHRGARGRASPTAGLPCSPTGAPRRKLLFDVSPRAFVPPPKVTSSRRAAGTARHARALRRRALEQVTAAAFGQRRKMLRQSLKSLAVDPARLAAAAGVDASRRAETIPVTGFVAMARELTNIRNTKPDVA